jgi:hypothetical protein
MAKGEFCWIEERGFRARFEIAGLWSANRQFRHPGRVPPRETSVLPVILPGTYFWQCERRQDAPRLWASSSFSSSTVAQGIVTGLK